MWVAASCTKKEIETWDTSKHKLVWHPNQFIGIDLLYLQNNKNFQELNSKKVFYSSLKNIKLIEH